MNGTDVRIGGTKQRTALAALLLREGRVLRTHELARFLWDEKPPVTASAQLHTYVSRLRMALGPQVNILHQNEGYVLQADSARIDYRDFRTLAQDAQDRIVRGEHESALNRLCEALRLWRGPALANTTSYLAEAAAPELEEHRIRALETRFESELRLGRCGGLVPELMGLVQEHPYREGLRAQLMRVLYLENRQGEAMQVFHEGRYLLAEELGVAPSDMLVRTYQAILRGDLSVLGFGHRRAGAPQVLR